MKLLKILEFSAVAISAGIAASTKNKAARVISSGVAIGGTAHLVYDSYKKEKSKVDEEFDKIEDDFNTSGLTPSTVTVPSTENGKPVTEENKDDDEHTIGESIFLNLLNSKKIDDSMLEINRGVYSLETVSVMPKSNGREVRFLIPLSAQKKGKKIGPRDEDIYFKNLIEEIVEDAGMSIDDLWFTKLGYEFVRRTVEHGDQKSDVICSNLIEREEDEDMKSYTNRINGIISSWETNQDAMREKALETRGEDVLGYRMYLSVSVPFFSKDDPRIGLDPVKLTSFIINLVEDAHRITSQSGEFIDREFNSIAVCCDDDFNRIYDYYLEDGEDGEKISKTYPSYIYIDGLDED